MRVAAIGGVFLYGLANIFAGFYDLVATLHLSPSLDASLVATGVLLLLAGILGWRRSRRAFPMTVVALALAFALAVFNERVLGMGAPVHHLIRGLYTLLVLGAAFLGFWQEPPVEAA